MVESVACAKTETTSVECNGTTKSVDNLNDNVDDDAYIVSSEIKQEDAVKLDQEMKSEMIGSSNADNVEEKVDKHEFAIPELPTFTKQALVKDGKEEVSDASERNSKRDDDLISDHIGDGSGNNSAMNVKTTSAIDTEKGINKKMKRKKTGFPYQEPSWGGAPGEHCRYSLTVLKEGTVKNNFDISGKALVTFGRLPETCDILIEHPSCSRYHAVLQYCTEEKDIRKVGYYVYDLGSTHGTYVNKEKVKPKVYVRVRVGYQIKFGGSSRLYIVEGPDEDQEEEIDMESVRKIREENKQKRMKQKQNMPSNADEGASWGFKEDAEEEELDLQALMEKKKNIEVKDPKKTLKGFFEREGIDFEYEMSQRGRGNSIIHVAQVRLPIESSYGIEVIAEGTSSNKKDAVLNCATDACKIIQAYDMMQNRCTEDQRLKRQRELEANDYYDSDDDNFLDRTGSVEKKRLKRKQWAGKVEKQEAETHESLKKKLQEKTELLDKLETKLKKSDLTSELDHGDDSLDAFMSSMENKLDKKSENQIKRQIKVFKDEIVELQKLIEMTQPALPTLNMDGSAATKSAEPSFREDSNSHNVKSPEKSKIPKKKTQLPCTTLATQKVDTEISEERSEFQPLKNNISPPVKKKKVYGVAMPPQKNTSEENSDKEFIGWLPPENQSGDGRTYLNDKLGY